MIIKKVGHSKSILKPFDLLGNDETALSKAFSYTLANEPKALFTFLQFLGVKNKFTEKNLKEVSINIEKVRDEGRTDIEIKNLNKFHIIIECKVRKNKVKKQRTQYIKSFDKNSKIQNILCFITQERDANIQKINDITIINLSWLDIIDIFNNKNLINKSIVKDFLEFSSRNYKMNTLKEILIQDLSDKTEMKRFKEFFIYKRDETFGTPLYFAPYFTKNAEQQEGEGIPYLSKVLGVLTLKPEDIDLFEENLHQFTDDKDLIKKWVDGVKLKQSDKIHTYYFLDTPLKLNKNLKKDGGIKTGRGKNWIAAAIPKNRNVSFEEFAKRMML
ncbi:hypothetical protein YH65_04250 [Sulfurovum lithotrophicum]|uniref:Uncharacterized protein n=1 Tax=Sulfurovum lithotrophicum TaxID=206403 RepID=A0A7U4M0L9_9BACT|nr:PD-(D/E)XK nuclease family protein [Sulfurovum lithotrophicum]AKF24685.1 hypothetical protein YH65_04250 [Sulfurovum lithotrophicum]